ncbi:hypothetical protein FSP39_024323 [Pinctada imbricata]|uniref:Uncharacterized protein n=1 Tax=Pinctada imbricata TaxID=66713 RepID=A0AA88YA57_PINIB|nr:hypothetical protein FSP39_024323 [Pinctada imbricata]
MATAIETSRGMATPMGFVNTETRVGDEVIVPGLAKDLAAFYDKTDSEEDRAKALELLTSLRLGQEINGYNPPPRPVTAAPAYGRSDTYIMNPYQTTYTRDYPLKAQNSTVAYRPMTSQGFVASHDLGGDIGDTTYDQQYHDKPIRPATPKRSGSSSGNRNNKPHPLESFMVWKFPSKALPEDQKSPWSEELTDDMINQVHKRLCSSTYQTDYLGIPQGFQVKSAYNLPPDWKADIPYTLDSVARYSYQRPNQQTELKLPTNRYGSNTKKQYAVTGTIPTASARYNHIKQRTTYDRHYNDNASCVVQQIRDIGRKLGAEALRKYYEKATGEEKEIAGKLLGAYGGVAPPSAPLMRPSSRKSQRSEVPPVSTPSSFRSKTPSTPGTVNSDSKPPIFRLTQEKHIGINKPRGNYAETPKKSSRTPAATPVTNFNNASPTPGKVSKPPSRGSKTPCTPVSNFEFTIPAHAPKPPDTPQSLPINVFSPRLDLQ